MEISKIGRYEIVGELGRGAMGVVYKGRDTVIDRMVAVKTIKWDETAKSLDTTTSINRLYQEAQIAGKLSHPNIATIFDMGEDKGIHFIVMEYIKGISLEKIIDEKRALSVLEKLNILKLIAIGLHYAHQKGVIHRDIKPANIMLLDNMQIKIMDFGIAKFVNKNKLSTTQPGLIFGTPFYMSPEQISGEVLDRQTDIFSLGVLSYELLTGVKPFQADNLTVLIKKILSETPLAPNEINKQIPKTIGNAILKALKQNKEERYPVSNDFADELELYVNQTEMGKTQDVVPTGVYDKTNLIQSLKKNYPFFSDFTDKELQQIFKISRKKVYSKDDVIFEEDTIGNKMFVIIAGEIKITKKFHNNEHTILNILHAGECFGEMAIMNSSPRFATALAESNCILIAINEVILRTSEPKLCLKLYKNLCSILSEKLKKSDTKMNELKMKLTQKNA